MSRSVGADRILALIGVGACATAATSLVGASLPIPLDAGLIAHVAGMLAGYLTAVMVLLMSRAPLLEREVGSDVLARWHSRGGRLFLVLVLIHAAAALEAWAQTRQQDLSTSLIAVMVLPWLIQATAGTVLFVVIAAISVRVARRRVSHETWHGLHLLTYVAISLAFIHELGGPNLAGHPRSRSPGPSCTPTPWPPCSGSGCCGHWRTPGATGCASRRSSPKPTASSASSSAANTSPSSAPRPGSSSAGASPTPTCGAPPTPSPSPHHHTGTTCGSPSKPSGTAAASSSPSAPAPASSPKAHQAL